MCDRDRKKGEKLGLSSNDDISETGSRIEIKQKAF